MKYSADKTNEICKFLRSGKERVDLFENGIVSERCFYEWMAGNIPRTVLKRCKTKKQINEKKKQFSQAIKKAEQYGQSVIKSHAKQCIRNAMDKQWTAAAWWLERKHPEEFAEQRKYDHTTGGEKLILNMKPSKFVNKKKKKKNDIQSTTTPADIPRVGGKV